MTVPSRLFATQIESNAASTAVGPFPTGFVRVTVGSVGSTRTTESGATDTHTPSRVNATPEGWPASGTASVIPDDGIQPKELGAGVSATHSASSPNAIPVGVVPACSRSVGSLVSGLIRLTVPSAAFVTHTDPAPTAIPDGATPTRIVSVTEPSSRSRRATIPRSGSATQRLPNPIALAPSRCPSSVVNSTAPSPALMRATEFVVTAIGSFETSSGIEIATSARTATIARTSTHRRDVPSGRRRRGRRERAQALDGIAGFGHDAGDRNRIGEALQGERPSVLVPHAVDPPREVRDLPRREDLAGASLAAQAGREVQGASSISPLHLDRLAGVETDPDRQRQLGVVQRFVDEPFLQVDGGADRLPRRGEHAERLVPAQLEQGTATALDPVARDVGELRRELRGGLVASLLREEASHPRMSAIRKVRIWVP